MLIVFGMDACPDCQESKEILDTEEIPYIYKEISQSTEIMKQFLKLRDTREEFLCVKKQGAIGVPCFLMEDNSILFDIEEILKEG